MGLTPTLDRRRFLLTGSALGCTAAASPLLTPIALAAAPWDTRLVVIILRGGMDGLDVVRPYGDPEFAGLRGKALGAKAAEEALDLDGFFALHPGLAPLMPLWTVGEMAFAHAVSTPYRDKRSHFDGQDLLEAGAGFGPGQAAARDGWLNRMLQGVPGLEAETAFAIGRENLLVLRGDAPVSSWAPDTQMALSPQAKLLLEIVSRDDPLFHRAVGEAMVLADELAEGGGGGKRSQSVKVADFAVDRLRRDTRIAAFSINGWDTHRDQARGLDRALGRLSDTILALRDGLGPVWGKTSVIAMTEFGRTARQNGTAGTDHGTGGLMLLAGGAVRGGVVHGRWPGLAEAELYDRRDLLPTADVRSYAAAVMRELLGLDAAFLETTVFPGLDMNGVGKVIL